MASASLAWRILNLAMSSGSSAASMMIFSASSRREGADLAGVGEAAGGNNPQPIFGTREKVPVVGAAAAVGTDRVAFGGGEGDGDGMAEVCAHSQPVAPQRRIPKSN